MPLFEENLKELIDAVRQRHQLKNEKFDLMTPTKMLKLFAKAGTLMDIIEPELKEKLVTDEGKFQIKGDQVWYLDLEFPVKYLLEGCF